MSVAISNQAIESLLQKEEWAKARKLIEQSLAEQPDNHWLLTQLGVTYYEQRKYREALRLFLSSLEIVPDCPLTLWNLAGALDALGKPVLAIRYYTSLLRSKKTAVYDSCWESKEWADALKTDCVYRLGSCFQQMERWDSAERCFRQYINLLLEGMVGSYTLDDAAAQIQTVHTNGRHNVQRKVREAINSTLRDAGIQAIQLGRKPSKLLLAELLAI